MTRTQLADAMIKGLQTPGVAESMHHYISLEGIIIKLPEGALCGVCALGSALVGYYNGEYGRALAAFKEAGRDRGEHGAFADLLDIPASLAAKVERKHLNGQTIEQIAKWLKSSEGGEGWEANQS